MSECFIGHRRQRQVEFAQSLKSGDVLEALTLNGAVGQINPAQGLDVRESLEPSVRDALVFSALPLEGIVAVVEIATTGHVKNLGADVAGRQIYPRRPCGSANQFAAEILDLCFQCQ